MSTRTFPLVALALAGALSSPLGAQSLSERVSSVRDGAVRMSFRAKPGVCGNGENVTIRSGNQEWTSDCQPGPVRVAMDVSGGRVVALRSYVGGRWTAETGATDLGTVPAAAAAAYLLQIARDGGEPAAKKAVSAAWMADSATVWPELLTLARNTARPVEVRKTAIFWLGQDASDRVAPELSRIARDESDDDKIRESAVFALSQRPRDEGVPALIDLVRTSKDGRVRKRALFWLGQTGDPRALALFEEILRGR